MRTVAQTVIAGAAELGETDPIVTMSAVEAGADLKIVGLWYAKTSLVLVADASRVKEYEGPRQPRNVWRSTRRATSPKSACSVRCCDAGIDINEINFVDIGGSGARMRALLAGRVQAVPMHLDQAAEMTKDGQNSSIMMEPWKEYRAWVNEVWIMTGAWLKQAGERDGAGGAAEGEYHRVPPRQHRFCLVCRRLSAPRDGAGRRQGDRRGDPPALGGAGQRGEVVAAARRARRRTTSSGSSRSTRRPARCRARSRRATSSSTDYVQASALGIGLTMLAMPKLALDGISKSFDGRGRPMPVVERFRPRGGRSGVRRHHRAERLRQVDHPAHHRWPDRAGCRRDPRRRRGGARTRATAGRWCSRASTCFPGARRCRTSRSAWR